MYNDEKCINRVVIMKCERMRGPERVPYALGLGVWHRSCGLRRVRVLIARSHGHALTEYCLNTDLRGLPAEARGVQAARRFRLCLVSMHTVQYSAHISARP